VIFSTILPHTAQMLCWTARQRKSNWKRITQRQANHGKINSGKQRSDDWGRRAFPVIRRLRFHHQHNRWLGGLSEAKRTRRETIKRPQSGPERKKWTVRKETEPVVTWPTANGEGIRIFRNCTKCKAAKS